MCYNKLVLSKIVSCVLMLYITSLFHVSIAQTIVTTKDSPKPSVENMLKGLSSYNFSKSDYGDGEEQVHVNFIEYYIQDQLTKFMKATCPDAQFGMMFYRPSTEHARINYTYSYSQHMARNGVWYWDCSNLKIIFYVGSSHYTYTFSIPSFSVAGNQFPGTLYNHLRTAISEYVHHHSAYSAPTLYKAKTGLTETGIKRDFTENGAYQLEGIYEDVVSDYGHKANKYKLAAKYIDGTLCLIYLDGANLYDDWKEGEVKAFLTPTASPGVFKAQWITHNKFLDESAYVSFEQDGFIVRGQEGNSTYIKLFPIGNTTVRSKEEATEWSGTGFALKNGYVVTNHHVVDGAKSIVVHGINGNASSDYVATVVATDRTNDLAILKITDSRFTGFGTIPYAIKNQMVDVGEDVWVLGYPLTQILGNEIKLTNGVVSSRSGFQGDVATYQITAPVQPGNSGGPLFDSKGNIVGVVNAGVPGAENVGYAIKTSYLINLADSYSLSEIIPTANIISSLSLKDQVKKVNNYVFFIECSSKGNRTSSSTTTNRTVASSPNPTNTGTIEQSLSERQDGRLLKKIERYITSTGAGSDSKIIKIELYEKATLVYFEYKNTKYPYGGWFSINQDTYLRDRETQKQYKMVKAYNVSLSPETTSIQYGETKVFVMAFPALPSTVNTIDFIEPDGSTWKFFNISLE